MKMEMEIKDDDVNFKGKVRNVADNSKKVEFELSDDSNIYVFK